MRSGILFQMACWTAPIFYMDLIRGKNVFWKKSPKSCKKATTTTAATAAVEEFSQAIQAPSPTHPGTTYPVRVSPHSDIHICQGLNFHMSGVKFPYVWG